MRVAARIWIVALLSFVGGSSAACASNAGEAPALESTSAPQLTTTTISEKTFVLIPPEPATPVAWREFGEPFDSYFGIVAYSNGKKRGNAAKYQCTELIHRYVSTVYGFPSRIGLGMGNGNTLAEGIATYFHGQTRSVEALNGANVGLEYFAEGRTLYPPVVGSIISMHFTLSEKGPGHVAILRELSGTAQGELTGALFAQHGKMPYKIGAEVAPDTVHFSKDDNGIWRGVVRSPYFKKDFRIVGWTTAVVQP